MLTDEESFNFPQDLLHVRDKVEDYFVNRAKKQFGPALCKRVAPDLANDQVQKAISDVLEVLPAPDLPAVRGMDLHLVFRHECLALGCRDHECTLCQYNPVRLCERNFGKKYLVGDALKAKCGAAIKVQLIDGLGQVVERDFPGVHFEVNLMDGVVYKEKGGEGRTLPEDDLKTCFKLANHRDEALLQHKNGGNHQRKIILKLEKGTALLPDLQVTDSSEALLTGRRPPFRLLVWAVNQGGDMYPGINYAYSEEFVVATRRVKQANKAEIPLVDDHVSKIEHIGRETVKKLQDLRGAATEVGVELNTPDALASITTVGQFRGLVELADKDVQMRKILQIVLKLSKEKWEEAAHHTMQAVVPDFRKRIWYPPGQSVGIGLLFSTKYGGVLLKEPVALVQQNAQGVPPVVRTEDQLDPGSLNILRQLKAQAVAAWWAPRHPGWGIYRDPLDPSSGMIQPPSTYPPPMKPSSSMKSDFKPSAAMKSIYGIPSMNTQSMQAQQQQQQGTPGGSMQAVGQLQMPNMGSMHQGMSPMQSMQQQQQVPQLPPAQALQLGQDPQAAAAAVMSSMSMAEGGGMMMAMTPGLPSMASSMSPSMAGVDMQSALQHAMDNSKAAGDDSILERPAKLQRTDSGKFCMDLPNAPELMAQPQQQQQSRQDGQPMEGREGSPSATGQATNPDGTPKQPQMAAVQQMPVMYFAVPYYPPGTAPAGTPPQFNGGAGPVMPSMGQGAQPMGANTPAFQAAWSQMIPPSQLPSTTTGPANSSISNGTTQAL